MKFFFFYQALQIEKKAEIMIYSQIPEKYTMTEQEYFEKKWEVGIYYEEIGIFVEHNKELQKEHCDALLEDDNKWRRILSWTTR